MIRRNPTCGVGEVIQEEREIFSVWRLASELRRDRNEQLVNFGTWCNEMVEYYKWHFDFRSLIFDPLSLSLVVQTFAKTLKLVLIANLP